MADAEAIALRVFEEIRAAFPELRSTVDRHPAEVELAMDFDAQPGLLFDVHLNLQNSDELHLNAAALWVSWFPCTEPDVTRAYLDSVCGLLAGRYRILEHRRGSRAVKAELQKPLGKVWETVTGVSYLSIPWPTKRLEVVQNAPAPRFERR